MSLTFDEQRLLKILQAADHLTLAGLKLLAFINGGAAVALLAYLGKIATENAGATAFVPPDLRGPIMCHIVGLVFCGAAFFFVWFGYFKLWELGSAPPNAAYKAWLTLAIVACVLSLIAFGIGSIWAATSFSWPL